MAGQSAGLAEVFKKFGLLDDERLQQCSERQAQLAAEGKSSSLAQAAVDLGFTTVEQIRKVMAHGGAANLVCPSCGNRYNLTKYEANRRYKCGGCKKYLELAQDDSMVGEDTGELEGDQQPEEPKPPVDPFIGKSYGKFKLERMIGKGGMGAVFLGRRAEDGKVAAVKILAEQFSNVESIVKRFKREAITGHKFNHKNIVRVFAAGRLGNNFYIASEFIDGPSLEEEIIKKGKMAPQRAVKVMSEILEGLQYAHERNLAHRDIKPANVLLTKDDTAKLIDFGLAKDEDAQTILTMVGNVMGTPSYMSPEQAKGERGGPASDLYSCGILLFVMLTGRRPFEGASLLDTLSMHINDPTPQIQPLNPAVPPPLENVVFRLMEKKPEDRYNDAAQAGRAIEQSIRPPDSTVRPITRDEARKKQAAPPPVQQPDPTPPPPLPKRVVATPPPPREIKVPVPIWIWIAFVGIIGGLGFLAYVLFFRDKLP